jgi:hypothetical protein
MSLSHPRKSLTSANTRPRYTPSIQAAASPCTSKPIFTAYRTTSAAEPRSGNPATVAPSTM